VRKVFYKGLYILLIFSFLFLSACSNAAVTKLLPAEDDTLRTVIVTKESSINWTKPLEDNRLKERIDILDSVSKGIRLNPDLINASVNICEPVYPYIENFATLRVDNLTKSNSNTVKELFNFLNTNPYDADTELINSSYIFNYVFFIYDLKALYQEAFSQAYPENKEAFSKYLIGEPFVTQFFSQVPVRLYCEKGSIDICVFISNYEKNLINQIEIIGWEVNYAK